MVILVVFEGNDNIPILLFRLEGLLPLTVTVTLFVFFVHLLLSLYE